MTDQEKIARIICRSRNVDPDAPLLFGRQVDQAGHVLDCEGNEAFELDADGNRIQERCPRTGEPMTIEVDDGAGGTTTEPVWLRPDPTPYFERAWEAYAPLADVILRELATA